MQHDLPRSAYRVLRSPAVRDPLWRMFAELTAITWALAGAVVALAIVAAL